MIAMGKRREWGGGGAGVREKRIILSYFIFLDRSLS